MGVWLKSDTFSSFFPSLEELPLLSNLLAVGKMKFFKKNPLKHDDSVRTKAAELTLKQSIYPLCLVTILFFLWVGHQPLHQATS